MSNAVRIEKSARGAILLTYIPPTIRRRRLPPAAQDRAPKRSALLRRRVHVNVRAQPILLLFLLQFKTITCKDTQ